MIHPQIHPGPRYVEAVESATRRHMMTLSTAEVALVAEALSAWGSTIPSHPGSEKGSSRRKSREARTGDDIMRRLPPTWSASAVLHTMRLRVLLCAPAGGSLSSDGLPPNEKGVVKETRQSLMSLVCSFRGLGCQAPQVWFEAVLEAEAELIRRDSPEEGKASLSDESEILKGYGQCAASSPMISDDAYIACTRHQPCSALRTRLLEVPGAADAMRLLSSRRPDILHGWDWNDNLAI